MRTAILIAVATLVVLPAAARATSSWDDAVQAIERDLRDTTVAIEDSSAAMEKEKSELLAELEALKTEVGAAEGELDTLKAEFERLLEVESAAHEEIAQESEEVRIVSGTVKGCLKDVAVLLHQSFFAAQISPANPDFIPSLEEREFPTFENIEDLVDTLFLFARGSGEIKKEPGVFINPEGEECDGTILRIGEFAALYDDGEQRGYLMPDSGGRVLTAVTSADGWLEKRHLESVLKGETAVLPVDFSGGIVFEQMTEGRSLIKRLRSGGPLVWPILLVAVVALILVLERVVVIGRTRTDLKDLTTKIRTYLREGHPDQCEQYLEGHSALPVCRVLRSGLEHRGSNRKIVESALQDAMLREMPRLERFLPTLSVLAVVSPLLGLLGTVTGMINTFRVITLFGTGDPRLMSGGISEALITTQLGLTVAIPIIIAHHFLHRRVDRIVTDMEEKATNLIVAMGWSRNLDERASSHVA